MRKTFSLLTAFSLSACSTGVSQLPGVNSTNAARAPSPAVPPAGGFRRATEQNAAGLAGVIGKRAGALTRRFGQPRIDLVEGDARKLQFTGSACVLDVFLYPRSQGAEPVATHVEARTRSDGSDTDRARCIREVERER